MGKRTWSEAEDSLLKDVYGIHSPIELEATFNRSYNAIKSRASRISVYSRKWTKEDEARLVSLYKDRSYSELAVLLGRTVPAIEHKAQRLGLSKTKLQLSSLSSRLRRKYIFDESYFSVVDTSSKSYILGFILGDGNISKNKYRLRLQIKDVDVDLLFFIRECMQASHPIHRKNGFVTLDLCSYTLIKDLKSLNMVPNKSSTLELPTVKEQFRSHLVRGLFDADGSISNDQFSIVGTKLVCQQVANIIKQEVGIGGGGVYSYPYSVPVYRVGGRKQVSKIATWLYRNSEFFLKRKHDIFVGGGLL